jgi:hypothetical protein
MITTATRTLAAQPARIGHRITRSSDAVRYMITGFVLLAISASSLFGAVTSWSQVDTSSIVGFRYVQVILAAAGCALVIGGLVQSRKQH